MGRRACGGIGVRTTSVPSYFSLGAVHLVHGAFCLPLCELRNVVEKAGSECLPKLFFQLLVHRLDETVFILVFLAVEDVRAFETMGKARITEGC